MIKKGDALTILIVDDEEAILEVVEEALYEWSDENGLRVVIDMAMDGETAVAKVTDTRPKIVFMDLNMPIMNGIDATKLIKAKRDDLPVIALTTSSAKEDVEKADGLLDAYLVKRGDYDTIYTGLGLSLKMFVQSAEISEEEARDLFSFVRGLFPWRG